MAGKLVFEPIPSLNFSYGDWRPSFGMRWRRGKRHAEEYRVLQQMWQRPILSGSVIHSWENEWRDVPMVEE